MGRGSCTELTIYITKEDDRPWVLTIQTGTEATPTLGGRR